MALTKNIIKPDSYSDSVLLMQIASGVEQLEGVTAASLMMGTPANKEILRASDLLKEKGEAAGNNDLIIAITAESPEALEKAEEKIYKAFSESGSSSEESQDAAPKTLDSALASLPGLNFALISVPGEYAAREASKALDKGLNVMIFSDNVTLDEEIRLKKKAAAQALILMGPDCGTAIINSVPLGFANRVRKGNIGIAAASGSGLQEVTVNIHKLGGGVSQAFGTGGRDLRKEVGGISMLSALKYLSDDPDTELILLLSKPPDPDIEKKIILEAAKTGKPVVTCFLGRPARNPEKNIYYTRNLEAAATAAVSIVQKKEPLFHSFTIEDPESLIEEAAGRLGAGEKYIRGLYAGGTLCDEALDILNAKDIRPWSNAGNDEERKLKDSSLSTEHTLLDMGEDEFTKGRPHPMIDLTLRNKRIIKEAADPETGVILFDLVLGYGAHPDPAGDMKDILSTAGKSKVLIASVCGTGGDPQNAVAQAEILRNCGVFVLPTNAQAARFAAEIIRSTK